MLRVGLTGGLGSGKSTVAVDSAPARRRRHGSPTSLAARSWSPASTSSTQSSTHSAPKSSPPMAVSTAPASPRLAFRGGRLDELNAIVHPAVIAAQSNWMGEVFARDPAAIAVIESALIFEVERDARARGEREALLADLRRRIDRIIVVTAPDDLKIGRYVAPARPARIRIATAEADARSRPPHQIPDAEKTARADYVLDNAGDRQASVRQSRALWQHLQAENNKSGPGFK